MRSLKTTPVRYRRPHQLLQLWLCTRRRPSDQERRGPVTTFRHRYGRDADTALVANGRAFRAARRLKLYKTRREAAALELQPKLEAKRHTDDGRATLDQYPRLVSGRASHSLLVLLGQFGLVTSPSNKGHCPLVLVLFHFVRAQALFGQPHLFDLKLLSLSWAHNLQHLTQ